MSGQPRANEALMDTLQEFEQRESFNFEQLRTNGTSKFIIGLEPIEN